MSNLAPLQSLIKLLADAAGDAVKSASDASAPAKLSEFSNLLPDVLALMPLIGQFQVSGLAPADYASLVESLVADLALPAGHAANVVNASVKLVEDLAMVILPDVEALVAAAKAAPAPAAPVPEPAPAPAAPVDPAP